MILSSVGEDPLKEIPMRFLTVPFMVPGAFFVSMFDVLRDTLWLCPQTALLTKGILWMTGK